MIPLRLQLQNFMSYGKETPPLDFRGISLACLSGPNGVGKSTLFEAMCWVLWGKSRAKSDDDLIKIGTSSMFVSFEFELEEKLFRVIRKRSKKGRGESSLEFLMKVKSSTGADLGWQSLSGVSKTETQQKIIDTLHMNYDIFINSAFLRQGRADEFTIKRPQERKEILSQILGLAFYDRLQEKAKEYLRLKEIEKESIKRRLEDLKEQIKAKEDFEKEMKRIEGSLKDASGEIKKIEKEQEELRDKKNILEKKTLQLSELKKRIVDLKEEKKDLEKEYFDHKIILESAEKLVSQKEKIEKGFHLLLANKKLDEELNKKLILQNKLLQEKAVLDDKIAHRKKEIEVKKAALLTMISEGERKIAQREKLKTKRLDLIQKLKKLKREEEKKEKLILDQQAIREKQAEQRTLLEQIRAEGLALKEKITLLEKSGAHCPLCRQALTDEHRSKVRAELFKLKEEKLSDFRRCEEMSKNLEKRIKELASTLRVIENRIQEKYSLEKRLASVENSLQEIEKVFEEVIKLKKENKDLDLRMKEGIISLDDFRRLEKVNKQLKAIDYKSKEHKKIRDKISSLQKFEGLKTKLEQGQEKIKEEKDYLVKVSHAIERKKQAIEEVKKELRSLSFDPLDLRKLEEELEQKNKQLVGLRTDALRVQSSYGAAKEKLERIKALEKEEKEKKKKLDEVVLDQSIYEELAVAFGKKGIQAMIIDSVIPEIEEEANRLLSRMTDSGMKIEFKTQRKKKTSKEGEAIETLDIQIRDEDGVRPYEMFSGGEAFRINFAIRIALSKLLARRAGAKLKFLVIDEGFGTQDETGRELLVEAINTVSHDFVKIFVITHIPELKDAFPQKIEVFKDAKGSHFQIVG